MASSSLNSQEVDRMLDPQDISLSEQLSKNSTPEGQKRKYECTEELDDDKDLLNRINIPGALGIEREHMINLPNRRQTHRFKTELEPEDVRLVNELGQLTADQLMEYLRKIKDMACGLGQAQEDQCLRGKFMGVFKQ